MTRLDVESTHDFDMFSLGYLKAVCEDLNADWFCGDVEGHLRKEYCRVIAEEERQRVWRADRDGTGSLHYDCPACQGPGDYPYAIQDLMTATAGHALCMERARKWRLEGMRVWSLDCLNSAARWRRIIQLSLHDLKLALEPRRCIACGGGGLNWDGDEDRREVRHG